MPGHRWAPAPSLAEMERQSCARCGTVRYRWSGNARPGLWRYAAADGRILGEAWRGACEPAPIEAAQALEVLEVAVETSAQKIARLEATIAKLEARLAFYAGPTSTLDPEEDT